MWRYADMTLVAGIDSSTQSCKVVICDAGSGAVVRSASTPHPAGTEVDPLHWWDALQATIAKAGGIADVDAVSVGGQQHGMVCLDQSGRVVRPALCGTTLDPMQPPTALIDEFGADTWAGEIGVVPVAALTVAKLRWLADNEPANADATAAICLPHDWLTWRLAGQTDITRLCTIEATQAAPATSRRVTGTYRDDVLATALRGRRPVLPRVLGPCEPAGETESGAVLGPGAGDNAAAALGLGAGVGDCIVSLGTSGVVSGPSVTFRPATPTVWSPDSPTPPAVPAAGLHTQRRPGAGSGGHDARRGPRRIFSRLALSAPPGSRVWSGCPTSMVNVRRICRRPVALCMASPAAICRRPTSPARRWRGCSHRWRSACARSPTRASGPPAC